jgi:hypothetical protein
MAAHRHAPRDCPVCGTRLELTRLSCPDCHTELSGAFSACEYCSLSKDERELLRVFLGSRGNMKELERHLGVSYPTARARYDAVLTRLGIEVTRDAAPGPEPDTDSLSVLDALARGDIDIEEASRRL